MTRWPTRVLRLAGCLAGALLLLGSCGDATPVEVDSGYVGAVDGTDAFIGLVVSGSNAAVYACDGDAGIAEYFWGAVDDSGGALTLESATGASIRAALVDGAFTGTLTLPDGSVHAFTADPARGAAGTYLVVGERAVAADVHAGWIIGNDGDERGALLRGGSFRDTPTFDEDGLVLGDEGFAMTRLVVSTDVEQQTSVTASDVVAPDDAGTSTGTLTPEGALRVPSPVGPIPIPLPNSPRAAADAP